MIVQLHRPYPGTAPGPEPAAVPPVPLRMPHHRLGGTVHGEGVPIPSSSVRKIENGCTGSGAGVAITSLTTAGAATAAAAPIPNLRKKSLLFIVV